MTTAFTSNDGFSTQGNITVGTGSYFIGDGSQLTGIAPTVQVYEFANVSSGVSTYLTSEWLASYTAGTTANATATVSTTPINLVSFITEPGYPGLTVIPLGVISVTIETIKDSGPQSYYVYANIYARDEIGTETLIATTDNSSVSDVNTTIQQTLVAYLTAPVTINLTDRLVTKLYARTVTGTADITMSFDDNTASGLQLPALPASVQNFIPYTGATANVNLGAKTLTTTGNISGANVSGGNIKLTGTVYPTTGLFVDPVRSASTGTGPVYYDPTSKELTYNPQLFFKGTLTTDITPTSDTDNFVNWTNVNDPLSWYTSGNQRITPGRTGWYQVNYKLNVNANGNAATGQLNTQVRVNNASVGFAQMTSSQAQFNGYTLVNSTLIFLTNTTDYIQTTVYPTTPGQTISSGIGGTQVSVQWISN